MGAAILGAGMSGIKPRLAPLMVCTTTAIILRLLGRVERHLDSTSWVVLLGASPVPSPDWPLNPGNGGDEVVAPSDPRESRNQAWWEAIAMASSLGLEFALATSLLALLGYYLDLKLGSGVLLTIVGGVLGAVAGFWLVIRTVLSPRSKHRP